MESLLNEINKVFEKDKLSYTLSGMLNALKEEIEIELKMNNDCENNYKKAIEMSQTIKNVQLGCGNHLLKDYINIDINEKADIYWDIRKSLPFKDNSINRIFSEHVFEHIDYPISVNKLLEESYRVLKRDGECIIGVPDCDYPLNDIYNNSTDNMKLAKEKWYCNRDDILDSMNTSLDYLNYVMRDQLFHSKFHPHYWGYNKENLTLLLEKYGFRNIKIWNPEEGIINPKRSWGTLYLIAKK